MKIDCKQNKNKLKTNLVSIKISYYSITSVWYCSQLDVNNNNCFVCYSSIYTLLMNNKNYYNFYYDISSADLCNRDLQITITLFKYSTSSQRTDWTSRTFRRLLCLVFYKVSKQCVRKHPFLQTNIIDFVIYYCSVVGIFSFTCLSFFCVDVCYNT